jgi:hypothetical protein
MAKLEEFSALDATALPEPFVPLSFLGSLSRPMLGSLMLASGKGESLTPAPFSAQEVASRLGVDRCRLPREGRDRAKTTLISIVNDLNKLTSSRLSLRIPP